MSRTARSRTPRRAAVATALLAATLVLVGGCGGGAAGEPTGPARPDASPPELALRPVNGLARGGDATVEFTTEQAGETVVTASVGAAGVSWATAGSESAVLSLFVDDRYVSDVVVTSAEPVERSVAAGELAAGPHTLRILFASDRSPQGARSVDVDALAIRTITREDDAYLAARHAPVLYGRTLAGPPDAPTSEPFQNAVTDAPLIAWHTLGEPDAAGHRLLAYTVTWSNEDGGTSTPALLARWGRTTDIEWVYQLEVDADGDPVPGTATFQAPDHVETVFGGRYEGDHPVLGTCTLNNNVCDTVGAETGAPMRFALDATEQLDAGDARETMMDRHPWTYQVMADELRRESRVAAQPVFGMQVNDPSEYLYVVVDKTTVGTPNTDTAWVGLTLVVRLAGDPTSYRSDLSVPVWAIGRDGAVATAVRLPPGTSADDIVGIDAVRVLGAGVDPGSSIDVSDLTRAFLLDSDDLPGLGLEGDATPVALTPTAPTATLFTAT